MVQIIEISDLSASELAVYTRLTEAQLRSKKDPSQAMFIAESHTVIAHALDAGCQPLSFLMERRQIETHRDTLLARCGNIPVYTADRIVLEQLTGYALTRGILCAMRRPAPVSQQTICRSARRLAVLEGIVDPTNVGAIFRSAAALHMDGVLLSPTCCDPLHRRAVRVSMGTVFQIPWAYAHCTAHDWPREGIAILHEYGLKTAALALTDNSLSIEDPRLSRENRLAVILGTEGTGLLPETINACTYTVKIPMARGVDSLNVAAASAVAFWQLRIPSPGDNGGNSP